MSCPLNPPIIKWKSQGAGNTIATDPLFPLNTKITGTNNTLLGYNAMNQLTSGSNNTAVGAFALPQLTTGGQNVAVGYLTAQSLATGSNNVSIGAVSGGTGKGNKNTTIGAYAGFQGDGQNRIIIGANTASLTLPNNSILLGNQNTTRFYCPVPDLPVPTTATTLSGEATNKFPAPYKKLPHDGIYKQNGYLYVKLPSNTVTYPATTLTANLVYGPQPSGSLQVLPFCHFNVNNPNVSIIPEQRFVATVTGFTTVTPIGPVGVSVALIKGKIGTVGTLSPLLPTGLGNPAYVNGARRTDASDSKRNLAEAIDNYLVEFTDNRVNIIDTVGQSTTIGLDWRYDSLELGVYTLCLAYYHFYGSYQIIQNEIPSINITCAPAF